MNVILTLVGVSIGGAFLVAGLSRSRRLATTVDAILMLAVTAAVWVVAYSPILALQIFGDSAAWSSSTGDPPPTLSIAAVAALVATVFSLRAAIAGEANLLFGAIGVWGLITLISVAPDVTTMFLSMQMASWLAWFEIGRRDTEAEPHAGLRGLLYTIAADLPLAFIAIMLGSRTGLISWETLDALAAAAGPNQASDARLEFLVIALICSASVRLAQFPLGVWLSRSVETSRVGRAFSTTLLSIPVGVVLLERATSLWSLSPVGRLLVLNAAPVAVVAAAMISLGQTRRTGALAVSVSAIFGVAAACAAIREPVVSSWALLVLAAAMVRPARSKVGRVISTVGLVGLFLVAVAPLSFAYSMSVATDAVGIHSRYWLLETVCLLCVFVAGQAVARRTDPAPLRDERTQPSWPSLMFFAAGVFLMTATEGGRSDRAGLAGGIAGLGIDRELIIALSFSAGAALSWWMGTRQGEHDGADQLTTIARLARRYFYVDELSRWFVVWPTCVIAWFCRGVDWTTSHVLTWTVIRHGFRFLDAESRLVDDRPAPVGVGFLAIVFALVVACLAGAA